MGLFKLVLQSLFCSQSFRRYNRNDCVSIVSRVLSTESIQAERRRRLIPIRVASQEASSPHEPIFLDVEHREDDSPAIKPIEGEMTDATDNTQSSQQATEPETIVHSNTRTPGRDWHAKRQRQQRVSVGASGDQIMSSVSVLWSIRVQVAVAQCQYGYSGTSEYPVYQHTPFPSNHMRISNALGNSHTWGFVLVVPHVVSPLGSVDCRTTTK